jgi:hypothetical protein
MATITTRLAGWPRARAARRAATAGASEAVMIPLASGERVLATTEGDHGAVVLGTDRAIYHRQPSRPSGPWTRLGWEQIARVDWEDQRGGLVLVGWTPDVPGRTVLALPRGDPLVALARERVAWTTLLTTRIPVAGYGQARVVVRRQPGTNRLVWMIALDDGVRDTPDVQPAVAAALARLRTEQGL